MTNQIPHEIGYKSKKITLQKLYESILTKKPVLEQAGFHCQWNFFDVGDNNQLFLTNSNYTPSNTNLPMYIATLWKDLPGESFNLMFSYYQSNNDVEIHGSIKIRGNQNQYDQSLVVIKEFQKLAGIELLVENYN